MPATSVGENTDHGYRQNPKAPSDLPVISCKKITLHQSASAEAWRAFMCSVYQNIEAPKSDYRSQSVTLCDFIPFRPLTSGTRVRLPLGSPHRSAETVSAARWSGGAAKYLRAAVLIH